jgi:outer membrane protein assembly factor BamE (lipoprotein component of BamABCDE complex)
MKKYLFGFISVVLVCLFIVSCTSYQAKTNRIEVGMTKQQVINIMGQPRDRNINGNTEAWYYWKAEWTSNPEAWIYFTDGRVSSMKTSNWVT